MILAIKTNQDPAELHLLDDDGKAISTASWQAGYGLSKTLLPKIHGLLRAKGKQLSDLSGLIVYNRGEGFTSLRLGVLTANTLAYSLEVPVVGSSGRAWQRQGITALTKAQTHQFVIPQYSRSPNITRPKK